METKPISEKEIKDAFYKSTERSHVIACWVGLILNLVWFISDYFVIPEYWLSFLIFRVSVSIIAILSLVLKDTFKINIYTSMFILVLGISIQNAYMWSVMDLEHFQKHTLAYIVLFIGVGMLVLWEIKLTIVIALATIISNVIFYHFNSKLTLNEFLINGGLLTLSVVIFMIFLIRSRYKLTVKVITSRLELEKSKEIIETQKEEVDEKNNEIISSLRYAQRLQQALLPPKFLLQSLFDEDYFIVYKPRDIVSGDFYWVKKINTTPAVGQSKPIVLIAVADCTGHGVPGAFMSLLGSNFLQQSSIEKNINTPAAALDFLNQKIITTLNHGHNEQQIRDGMDISLIAIDTENKQLAFAGANNPIYIIREGKLEVLKADKQAIGNMNDVTELYNNQTKQLLKGDCIYMFTDGFADQFGGPKGKKLMKRYFEETLIKNHTKSMAEQKNELEVVFNNWKGNLEQVDDICIFGIRIK